MMMVRMLYFAWVRERIGLTEEQILCPPELADVAGLVHWLAGRSPGHREALDDPSRLRAAIDGEFVRLDARLEGAREVSLFPPVTGG